MSTPAHRIEVTAEDVRLGNRGSRLTCPVARAINRATGHEVVVEGPWVYLDGHVYKFEQAVCERIARFDNGGKMEPFEFELREVIE